MTIRRRQLEHLALREAVQAHAQPRHGVFQRADLDALGIDHAIIRTFVRRGWWTRLHHGVYIDTDVLKSDRDPRATTSIFLSAAMASLPGPAYAYAASAAALHELAVDQALRSPVSIVRPLLHDQRAFRRRISGSTELGSVSIHSHALNEAHLTVVDGIPTVDMATAALATAAQSELMWAVATLDSLLWRDSTQQDRLSDLVEDWHRIKGIGTVRKAMDLTRPGAQTPLESVSRFRLIQAGLPEPILQLPVFDADGLIGYADMAWPDHKVIGEADGLLKYQDRSDLIAEKAREDRLRAQGWIVVRWTWDEMLRRPHVVVARIVRAMNIASTRIA